MDMTLSAVSPSSAASGRTILIPTFSGHFDEVGELLHSIRATETTPLSVVLVVSQEEAEMFEDLARAHRCTVFLIEDLVEEYTGRRITGRRLLAMVDRYRYQVLKKLLGIARLQGSVLLIDSESRIRLDLNPIFEAGLPGTTVFHTVRPWSEMPRGLAKDVFEEVGLLLGRQPNWYFESLNWLFDADTVRALLDHLKRRHGGDWAFRPRQLFESQLYFQFAHARGVPYRFIPAEAFLAERFGAERAASILRGIYSSPLKAAGVFEFLARFITRQEYIDFISDDDVQQHFRLLRYEPYEFYDIIGEVRRRSAGNRHFFGEAAMHRGPFLRGRTAVLLSGFTKEQDIYTVRSLVSGVECDLFVAIARDHWMTALIQDLLAPTALVFFDDDEAELGSKMARLAAANGVRQSGDCAELLMEEASRLFSEITAAYGALLAVEAANPGRYGAIVRLRADMFSMKNLRDAYWDTTESTSELAETILVPQRFWGEGINDHFFFGLRDPMGLLLDSLTVEGFSQASYLNSQYHIGEAILANGLKPIPILFPYMLGHLPIEEMSAAYDYQSSSEAMRPVPVSLWKDASDYLRAKLADVLFRNQPSRAVVHRFGRNPLSYMVARGHDGSRVLFTYERHRSVVSMRPWSRLLTPFVPYIATVNQLPRGETRSVNFVASGAEEADLPDATLMATRTEVTPVPLRSPWVLNVAVWLSNETPRAIWRARGHLWTFIRRTQRRMRQRREQR